MMPLDWGAAEAQQLLVGADADKPASLGSGEILAGLDAATYGIIMAALQKQGLKATSACFRHEIGSDIVNGFDEAVPCGGSAPDVHGALVTKMPCVQEGLSQRYQAARAANGEGRRRVERCAEVMVAQRRRLEGIRTRVQQIRGEYQGSCAAANNGSSKLHAQDAEIIELQHECSNFMKLEDTLREQLNSKEEEASELRKSYEQQKAVEAELWAELTQKQAEVQSLRESRDAALAATAAAKRPAAVSVVYTSAPAPVQGWQMKMPNPVDIIRSVLSVWDGAGGAHENDEIRVCFAECDSNWDGKLDWNLREIVRFVGAVFNHHGLSPPSWPEHVWYEMYRSDDLDHSYSLDINEALRFAKHCLQVVLRALESDNTPVSYVQKVPASAVNFFPVQTTTMLPSAIRSEHSSPIVIRSENSSPVTQSRSLIAGAFQAQPGIIVPQPSAILSPRSMQQLQRGASETFSTFIPDGQPPSSQMPTGYVLPHTSTSLGFTVQGAQMPRTVVTRAGTGRFR